MSRHGGPQLPVVLQESGPDGDIAYTYGLGLISETSSNFDYFYHYDGLGSVVALSNTAGKLSAAYLYDTWGNSLLSVSDFVGTKNKFRFTGEALDAGTQLYYLRARYYDPSVGRFVSRDPTVGFPGYVSPQLNRYLYAGNDPIRNIDPEGLSFFGDIWSKTAAISDTLASASILSVELFVKGNADAVNFVTRGKVGVVNNLSAVLANGEQLAAQKLVQSEGQVAGIDISQADQASIASQVVQITNLAASALYAAKFVLDAPQAIGGIGKISEDISLSHLFGGSILLPSLTLGKDVTSELLDTIGFGQSLTNSPK